MTVHPAARPTLSNRPTRSSRSSRSNGWVPFALVALVLVPALAGSLRLVELAGGPHVMPANPRLTASPLPVVVHIMCAVPYAVLGAFQFSSSFRRRSNSTINRRTINRTTINRTTISRATINRTTFSRATFSPATNATPKDGSS